MATLLPTSPFVAHSEPHQPVEREFSPNEELFMRCIVPDPLPDIDDPPEFLREVEADLTHLVSNDNGQIGGFHEDSCR